MILKQPVTVAVVYDSASRGRPETAGRTRVLAEAVRDGAASVPDVEACLMHASDVDWAALDSADAIVFGTPTYMGSGSAVLKAFMEESLSRFQRRSWQDKLAGGFTNSAGMSGDKLMTLQQLAVFAAQHGMIWVSLGMLPGWTLSSSSDTDLNRLGAFLGPMAQSNVDHGPDAAPPASDRETARRYGERMAQCARRWAGLAA